MANNARKTTTSRPAAAAATKTTKTAASSAAKTVEETKKPEEPKPEKTTSATAKATTPKPEKKVEAEPAAKADAPMTSAKPEPTPKAGAVKPAKKAAPAAKKPAEKKTTRKAKASAAKAAEKKTAPAKKPAEPTKSEAAPKAAAAPAAKAEPAPKAKPTPAPKAEEAPKAEAKPAPKAEAKKPNPAPAEPKPEPAPAPEPNLPQPRRSVAFIGSECYPFVKTGGLGDVMYALPKALVKQNCDVKVIVPKYACIKQEWKDKMVYRGSFQMDLCSDGRSFYVGIMEYVSPSGVVYDFIDNEDFFSYGNPYTNLVDDIPRFCYFSKAALAALNYMGWIPDVIHCHDWQAALVPIFLKTMFQGTYLARSKTVLTIHNLRFQGKYNIPTIKYWTNLPDSVFNMGALQEDWTEANCLKGGLAYADMITTVSGTYAQEIQTPEYGEKLDDHLRYYSWKLRGIVNGIDPEMWNPATDKLLAAPYSAENFLDEKPKNKRALQEELGLEVDDSKMVIGLISRLTNQKGLDLVNDVIPGLIDGNTQIVILGTGDPQYEDSFRYYENTYKGQVCSNIMYDEGRAHRIYAGADALMVPSRFEPCGLTQLIAMHYGTVPIVRETGGLKDTVQPYNQFSNEGNGFTFDRYESGLLYDAVNRAKTLYFTNRWCWDQMVRRDMEKDVTWDKSAQQYRWLYLELTQ
ncbi:MAG: glycogen synthase [Tractidigestivibacter sp.]|uniref:glycogen synthase n=1 Tax=Tractidigestivibacter sp. TaxID=2847320 RepID=UPI003D8D1FA5